MKPKKPEPKEKDKPTRKGPAKEKKQDETTKELNNEIEEQLRTRAPEWAI
jgi:hypothetical protein